MKHVIKICGLTTREDVEGAVRAGATAVGFNFYRRSLRYLTPDAARKLAALVPPDVWRVGVFVDTPLDEMLAIAERVGLDSLQLHGDELPDGAIPDHLRVVVALRVGDPEELTAILDQTPADPGCVILLDAYVPGEYGGTGREVDDRVLRTLAEHPARSRTILAGGLTPANVQAKIRAVNPLGVDVASGVESAPGVKDLGQISQFIAEARRGWSAFADR